MLNFSIAALTFLLNPIFIHVLGALATWIIVAYITRPRVQPLYYIPLTRVVEGQQAPRNAYRPPVESRGQWLWLSSHSGRRGCVGAVLFATCVYPILGYDLWSHGYQPLVILLGIMTMVFSVIFGLILVNVIPYLSPAGGFWSLVCGITGWYASYVGRHAVAAMPQNFWGEVGGWVTAAFLFGIPLVFIFPLVAIKCAQRYPGRWLVYLNNVQEAVFTHFAGDIVDVWANMYKMNFYEGSGGHHAPHIPLPFGINDMGDRVLWTVFGIVPEGYTVRTPQGVLRGFPRQWAGTVSQRMSQRHMVHDDPRRNHVTPSMLVVGIPILVELLSNLAHSHGEGDAHGHHGPAVVFSLARRVYNFPTQPIENRVGMETVVKIGAFLVALFPWLGRNVEDVHAAQHQHMDHLGAALGKVGEQLLGRAGAIEDLAAQGLPAVGPGNWTIPQQLALAAIEGLVEVQEHVQMLFILDTGEGLTRVAVEDTKMDPTLKRLWNEAVAIHFHANVTLSEEMAEAIRMRVKGRVDGIYGTLLGHPGFQSDAAKAAIADSLKAFVLDLQSSVNTGAFLNLSTLLQGSGGGGQRGGGTP